MDSFIRALKTMLEKLHLSMATTKLLENIGGEYAEEVVVLLAIVVTAVFKLREAWRKRK